MGDEPVRRRFQRRGGQRAVEVRFVERDGPQPARGGIAAQPAERLFVGRGEQDESVRGGVPVTDRIGMSDGELERGVRGLTGLRPRWKVGTGDDVEARNPEPRVRTLAVWHGHEST